MITTLWKINTSTFFFKDEDVIKTSLFQNTQVAHGFNGDEVGHNQRSCVFIMEKSAKIE